jgi:hypothetical protein
MSEREQQERVTERAEPLADTQARLETTLRTKGVRLVLLGLLALGGLGTAHETGALGLLVPKNDAGLADFAREQKQQRRLLKWLVRQEARRQIRECVAAGLTDCRLVDPPEDVE